MTKHVSADIYIYIYIYIHIFSYTTINLYDKPMTSVLYNALGKHFVFKRKEQEQTVTLLQDDIKVWDFY